MYSFRRVNDIVDKLVSDKTGIINKCIELHPEADAPQLFHFYAQACDTALMTGYSNFKNTGGVSTDRRTAMAKAIGEAIERYCSSFYSIEDQPLCSYKDAYFKADSFQNYQYFTPAQFQDPEFPFVPFCEDTLIRWTPAIDIKTLQEIYVPSASVWMPYYFDQKIGEAQIYQTISTGLSCHCSLEEAILGGLLEVIERDGFSLTWQGMLSHPHIIPESLSDANHALLECIEQSGHSVTLLNGTTDLGIPTIIAVAFSECRPAPPLVVSAASDLDPEDAIRKALEELVHTRRYMRELQAWTGPEYTVDDYNQVKSQIDHLKLWGAEHMANHAKFLISSENRVKFNDIPSIKFGNPKTSLIELVERIHSKGYSCLFTDLTTSDIRSLGLRVVRAIIPGLHPFFIGHKWRARNCKRLYEAPQQYGHQPVSRNFDNPIPHPFP